MTIVTQPWYDAFKRAAQLTAEDAFSLIKGGAESVQTNPDYVEPPEGEEPTVQPTYMDYNVWFATKHEFYDAFIAAFGDDEDEGIEFDWNINLALLWILGLRPSVDETEAGFVLTWRPVAGYNPDLTFKEAYMEVTVALQNLWFGESEYCQRSFLTILEKLGRCHKLWRSETAPEHLFVLEYAVVPNEPFFEE